MSIDEIYAGQRAILETWAMHEITPFKLSDGREPEPYDHDYVEGLRDRLKQMRNGDLGSYKANLEANAAL